MSSSWRRNGLIAFAALGVAHFILDAYATGYAPLLAVLRERLDLNLTQVGWCAAVMAFSSSLMQPIYGFVSDRLRSRYVIAFTPALTGLGLAALAWTTTFSSALVLFFVVGIGIAAFHPQGAMQVRDSAPMRPGLAMSLFIGVGSLGMAVGPLLIAWALVTWGWEGLWRISLPALLATLLLLWLAPDPEPRPERRRSGLAAALWEQRVPLTLLYLIVVVRGTVQLVYQGFLPLYFIETGYSLATASWALSVFLGVGVIGGLLGGVLSDRFGGRFVIRMAMAGSLPFLLVSFWLTPAWQLAFLSIGYAFILLTMPVNLIMAQDCVPEHRSTISSLMMGFAWGVGGALAPVVGKLADEHGLSVALMLVGGLPLVGALLAWLLPDQEQASEGSE
jgi:FSR family fosmidomycin resistance protein-like MFS transporter